ncbi:Hypothetical protein, putative [Bodo saltans]|uniref:Uncharacterized protein n=1 Tax=Bodo saltans TaxID=75058 RepID=A0A0S4JD21_BODSA|nr:Hypothetical protein, putative [Bodo saltans]|eukprot:CUG89447.1 Hypothetical protein, putative [Bodo saltans]
MTEFKKVQQLLEIVREHVLNIRAKLTAEEQAYAVYHDARHVLVASCSDLLKRDRKLYLKAVEADPNRQIYNETMCGKIMDLHKSVTTFFGEELQVNEELCERIAESAEESNALFSSACVLAEELQERYEHAVVTEASSSAWAAAVANNVATIVDMQQVARVVLEVEEKNAARQMFLVDAVGSRAAARAAEDARAAARWNAEMQRREHETSQPLPSTVAEVIRSYEALVDRTQLSRLCKRLAALLREVHANPERQEIRTLRYVPLTIEHFGHPGVVHYEGCACRVLNTAAETVLRMAGYCARYNTKPSYNVVVMELFAAPSSTSFPMPCGRSSAEHRYHAVGFEMYGERTLVLAEPDPQIEMDAWCSWHEAFEVAIADLMRVV